MNSAFRHVDSLAVHAGREDLTGLGVHALPIDLSSTNPLPDIECGGASYEAMATGGHPDPAGGAVYARLWNPTVARFESALARLERAEAAVAFASGMAAMTAAIIASTSLTGKRHVVAVRPLYGGTDHLLASRLLSVEVTFCTEHEVAASLRPDTALVLLETPANPTLDLVDIVAVAAQAGTVPLLVDNTFATPVLQNPIPLGATMALHSATKYLGGHGDVVGGVIACDEETAVRLRQVRAITGALLHPLGAYLLHRGLATLPTRVRAQQAGARVVAAWLREHPAIERVYYPGFDGDPRGLIGDDPASQMRGTGAMVAVALRGDRDEACGIDRFSRDEAGGIDRSGYDAARRLTSSVRLFTHAVSLGGVDSLIQHPAALTHRPVAAEAKPATNIVRLSIGLEHPDDLIADLEQALSAARLAVATSV